MVLGADTLRLAEDDEILRLTGGPQGFSGPVGLRLKTVADARLRRCAGMVTGAMVILSPILIAFAERIGAAPNMVVEPRPRVGRARWHEPEQIVDGALQPQRRRMPGADAWVFAVRASVTEYGDLTVVLVNQR